MPTLLESERFAAARGFLLQQARPLEAALFRHHFEEGPRDAVLDTLAAYQNRDGGFGHALEPDLRAPQSSAICTSVAFQALRSVGAVKDTPLADRGVAYLLDTLDRELASWRIVPPESDTHPHAPWWNQSGRDHGYDAYSLNPTAELLGVLLDRPDLVPAHTAELVAERVFGHLEGRDELEMHDLLCVLRLHGTPSLSEVQRVALSRHLRRLLKQAVARDVADWSRYGLRPLQVVDGPSSPFRVGLEEEVERNLDFEIEEQQADGSWAPTWSWGDAYAEVWPTARAEWAGVLTLQRLLLLSRHGRVAT